MSSSVRKPVVYVIYYSMFGHVETLARTVVKGLERSGVTAKLFQVAETLPEDVNIIPIVDILLLKNNVIK